MPAGGDDDETDRLVTAASPTKQRREPSSSSSGACWIGPEVEPEVIENAGVPLDVTRSLTDKFWLLAILIYAVFMILVWAFSVSKGQYMILVNGMDWRGKACGVGTLAEYSHQAWTNPLMANIAAGAICVKDCKSPSKNAEVSTHELRCICNTKYWPKLFGATASRSQALIDECNKPEAKRLGYFTKNVNADDPLRQQASTGVAGGVDQPCAFLYRTKWAMRKCVPWLSAGAVKTVVTQGNPKKVSTQDHIVSWLETTTEMASTFMTDAASSVHIFWVCALIAILLSLIMLTLLARCTGLFIRFIQCCFFALFVMFIVATVAAWWEFNRYSERLDVVPQLTTYQEDTQSKYVFLGFFLTGIILSLMHACLSVFMCKHIDAAQSIIKLAAESFSHTSQILLYPIVHVLAFVTLLLFWIIGAVLLYSAGDITVAANGVASLVHTEWMRSSAVAYLIGLIWFTAFLNAMGYMIVAGTVFMTAFVLPKSKRPYPEADAVPAHPMTTSTFLCLRWHMGTAAFGSLVLTIAWILRMFVNFFAKMAGERPSYVCCCCNCFTIIFRDCMRYMNKMAYLQTVLHGYDFCDAAFIGLQCVVKGIDQIGTTTYISSFVMVVIKIAVSLSVTAIADAFIKWGKFGVESKDITYSWVPLVIVGLTAYAICTAFMVILDVAIDSILAGWCEAMIEVKDETGELQRGAFVSDHLSKGLKEHMNDERWNQDEDAAPLMGEASK
jgi:choline transporter-like protein 2/4/5